MADRDDEDARQHAWWHQPVAVLDEYWDPTRRTFVLPDGWPPGVDHETYEISSPPPASTPSPGPKPDEDVSPSVARLRQVVNGGRP